MSGSHQLNLFLVPDRELREVIDRAHGSLLGSGFEVEEEASIEEAVLPPGKTDLAFLPYTLTTFVVRTSWRGDPGTNRVKVVCLDLTGKLNRHGGLAAVDRLVEAARKLHTDLGAARTLWGWDLDASTTYRWQEEWERLQRGIVEGSYWLDIIDLDLVDADVIASLRKGGEREFRKTGPLFIRRSAWP